MSLGATLTLPTEDRHTMTGAELRARVLHAMGGRAAEDLVFKHFSTGAADDLRQATKLARDMVCRFGMSERLGPISLADESTSVFLGRDLAQHREYSEQKAREIDEEVSALLNECYQSAVQLLTEHREALDRIAAALLERETLGEKELNLLLEGQVLPPLPLPEEPSAAEAPGGKEADSAEAGFGEKGIPDPEPIPG